MERLPRARIRFKHHPPLANLNDGIKCQNCCQLFETQRGLDHHQSQTKFDKIGCHRAQILQRKSEVLEKSNQRKEIISSVKVKDIPSNADLSTALHAMGLPITGKKKDVF